MNSISGFSLTTSLPGSAVLSYGSLDGETKELARTKHQVAVIEERPLLSGGLVPDAFYKSKQFTHLTLLDLADASEVAEILRGAKLLMKYARLDWVNLPLSLYTPGALPTDIEKLLQVNFARISIDMALYDGVSVVEFHAPIDHRSNILVNRRLVTMLMPPGQRLRQVPLLDEITQAFGIDIGGVVHVGANMGQELPFYEERDYRPVLMIEANPRLAHFLEVTQAENAGCYVANVAATDHDGTVVLNITGNNLQASSLLPPSGSYLTEEFAVTERVEVPGRRLDGLLADLDLPMEAFSLLHLDIQGAEAMALRGATELLKHVDVVLSEISWAYLYDGSAQIEDIDDLLEAAGFSRVAIDCTYSPDWGDGIYVRTNLLPI